MTRQWIFLSHLIWATSPQMKMRQPGLLSWLRRQSWLLSVLSEATLLPDLPERLAHLRRKVVRHDRHAAAAAAAAAAARLWHVRPPIGGAARLALQAVLAGAHDVDGLGVIRTIIAGICVAFFQECQQ